MSIAMLPSSLPFDILPATPVLPAALALHNGSALMPMQGERHEVDTAAEKLLGLSADASLVERFGAALTELLAVDAPEVELREMAESSMASLVLQPKRTTAMILPVADNSLPRREEADPTTAATSQVQLGNEAEGVAIAAEVLVATLVEEQVGEQVEEKELERDEEAEAAIAPALLPLRPVEEQEVMKATALIEASKPLPEPNNKIEDKQVEPSPVAPLPQAKLQGPERQLQAVVRRTVSQPGVNPSQEHGGEVEHRSGMQHRNAMVAGEDIGVEGDAAAQDQPSAEIQANESAPKEDRVTLRFRESMVSKPSRDEAPEEASKSVPPASEEEAASKSTKPEKADVHSAATMPEISPSAPPVAQRMDARGAEIAPRLEAHAADKPQALPAEQRPQSRVSAATTATILDKQASGAVKTVSIRLPIEDGSRAGSAVQIDLARKNSVLEVRLTGTSDGLQRAVTESIDSLVQKLAVDRWSLDAPASPDRSSESMSLPRMESILPENGESSARPTLRMPSQEIASAAREMAPEAPAQSSSGQASSDGQRNQDFQQDSGARQHPQQQQEEQKRPRREVWGQFLEAAEESFEAGLLETAPELQ
jgi:hypothetical protein